MRATALRAATIDDPPPRLERCWRCGAAFDRAAWRRLAVVQRVDPPEIQHSLLNWPPGLAIEVRRCTKCGSHLARKALAAQATS